MKNFLFHRGFILILLILFLLVSCKPNQFSIPSSDIEGTLRIDSETTTVQIITPTETVKPTLTPTFTPLDIIATEEALTYEENLRIFDQFIADLKNGESDKIVGVWIENILALKVIYQPSGKPEYVSSYDEVATYFLYVWQKSGNHGLLAHDYLAGRYFFNIQVGDIVTIVFGDGNYEDFEVTYIDEYQALQPNSPYSDFMDLVTGEQLSSTELFVNVYMGDYKTTLQTCITKGAETSWGRRFTLAPPL